MFVSSSLSKKLTPRRSVLIVSLVLLTLTFALVPAEAHAGGCNWWVLCANKVVGSAVGALSGELIDAVGGAVIGIVSLVLQLWAAILWQIVSLITRLFTFVLYEVNQEIGFIDNILVIAGWSIVRDIVNWFFVIIFLVSAIATILDIPKYSARAVLPRLLIVAVLINFSLWITGFFVNIAQVITGIFVTVMAGAYPDIGQAFLSAAAIQDLRVPNLSVLGDFLGKELGDQLTDFLGLLFSIIMLAVFGFAIAFLTIAMILRNIMLWVLMILSPLAFMAAILPTTQKFWSTWLQKFTQYTVFLPIAVFFIWLGTWLILMMSEVSTLWGSGTAGGESYEGASLLLTVNESLQFVTIVIFLFLSVTVTKWLASEAGGMAQRVTGKAIIGGLAGAALAGRGARTLGRQAYRRAPGTRAPLANSVNRAMARLPVLRGLGERGLAKQTAYTAERAARVDQRDYKNRSDKDIDASARGASRATVMNDTGASAIIEAHTRGRDMDKLGVSEDKIVQALKRVDRLGRAEDAKKADPALAAKANILASQKDGTHEKDEAGQIKAAKAYMKNISSPDFAAIRNIDIAGAIGPNADAVKKAILDGFREGLRDGSTGTRQLSALGRAAESDKGAERAAKTVEGILKIEYKNGRLDSRTQDQLTKDPILQRMYDLT